MPTMTDLGCLFRPSSIAVVGASDRAGSRGAELLANLRSIGFSGVIHPVNPRRSTVAGIPAFPRLSDVGAAVDVVAIGVDQAATLSAVEEAVGLGAQAVLVLGIGYAETGEQGRRAQERLAALCRAAGARLVGPNSLGVWSRLDHISYWLAPGSPLPLSGIGLITQSGALASSLMEPLSHRGIALDAVAATGNEADADVADFLSLFAADPRLRVIGLIAESLRRPQELLAGLQVARAHGKAVVCLLTGTSQAGREAAVAHSAALLGDGLVARAYLGRDGALIVDDLAGLTEHLVLFSHAPTGLRPGVAVTTVSGGGAGVVADIAEDVGLGLTELQPATLAGISDMLAGKRVTNPVDVALAGDVPGTYDEAVSAVAADPGVGTVAIGLNLPHAFDEAGSRFYADQARAAGRARAAGKDVVAFSFVPGEPDSALRAAASEQHMPLLLGTRESLEAIATAMGFHTAGPADRADRDPVPDAHGGDSEPGEPTPWSGDPLSWDECDLRSTLAAFGVPVAAEERVASAEAAVAAATRIGFPVALRILAPGLTHKSEHGAIRLALVDGDAVADAYAGLEAVAAELEGVRVRGMSVQAMAPAGTELILGSRLDPGFGRALILSWGGVWAEAFPRPQIAPVPLSPEHAWRLINCHFGPAYARAQAITDLDALHAALLAFAAALGELPAAVDVLEVNPIILSRDGVVAVDAAVAVAAGARPSEAVSAE
jgi:acetate---CoA ligase (ADP-forming)